MKKINYIFLELIIVIAISLAAAYYFFILDKNFIYSNNYFPWDSIEYLKALKNYEHNFPIYNVGSPFNERLLFPFFVYKISLIFRLEYIDACLFLNLFSSIISFLIFFIISIKINISIVARWLLFIIFMFSWEGPLRTSLFYPGSTFGFDCLLISMIILFGYLYLETKNIFYKIFLFTIFFFFTLQRGLVVTIIPLTYLFLNYFVRKITKSKAQNNFFKDSFFYCFILSLIAYFFLKFISISEGNYSLLKTIIKYSYFRLHPLEFLYTYYLAFGPIFLIFVSNLFFFKKDKIIFFFKKNVNKKFYLFFFSIFISSILISTIGGDDSNRFISWYFVLYLLFGCLCLDYFLNINKKFTITFILIIGLFWSRFFIPSQPPLAFAEKFIFNQYVGTNYDEKFYYGINFFKKFRNKLYKDRIVLGDPFNLEKTDKYQDIFVTQSFLDPKYYHFYYQKPYKYQINNIPFPLGYLHNQRDALVDHPTFGKPWVRLFYMLQWIVLTAIFIFVIKKILQIKYDNI
jgi:hypothetical protein